MKSSKNTKRGPAFLDIVTVNDKGQVVIPAEARSTLDLQVGDKLLVMLHPTKEGVLLMKPAGLESYAKQMLDKLSDAKERYKK